MLLVPCIHVVVLISHSRSPHIGVARTFRLGGKLFSAEFEVKILLLSQNLER